MGYKLWSFYRFYPPALGTFWNSAIRPSVPRRSCLGYRHAGCLQLSHRRPPEICGLRTRPRTDVDPPRFSDLTAIGGGGAYRLAAPGAIPSFLHCRGKSYFCHHGTKARPCRVPLCSLGFYTAATGGGRRALLTTAVARSVASISAREMESTAGEGGQYNVL